MYLVGTCPPGPPVRVRADGFTGPKGTAVRLKEEFFTDLQQHDLLKAASRISPRPLLVIHGTADDVVPIQDAIDLGAAAGEPKELLLLPGADHQLSRHYQQAWEAVYRWIGQWALAGNNYGER
ncbi:MAG: alpha/beta hydrolase [Clostridia bacterium]|nr:MAG: alpha/beta hydrolase [Clostridia bacterium]